MKLVYTKAGVTVTIDVPKSGPKTRKLVGDILENGSYARSDWNSMAYPRPRLSVLDAVSSAVEALNEALDTEPAIDPTA